MAKIFVEQRQEAAMRDTLHTARVAKAKLHDEQVEHARLDLGVPELELAEIEHLEALEDEELLSDEIAATDV